MIEGNRIIAFGKENKEEWYPPSKWNMEDSWSARKRAHKKAFGTASTRRNK